LEDLPSYASIQPFSHKEKNASFQELSNEVCKCANGVKFLVGKRSNVSVFKKHGKRGSVHRENNRVKTQD
jgi:hypothetical protein